MTIQTSSGPLPQSPFTTIAGSRITGFDHDCPSQCVVYTLMARPCCIVAAIQISFVELPHVSPPYPPTACIGSGTEIHVEPFHRSMLFWMVRSGVIYSF